MSRDFDHSRKRIVIHAGYHKTGTTSIQVAFSNAREQLLDAGILYPRHGIPSQFPYGHHLLPWSLKGVPRSIPILFDSDRHCNVWLKLTEEIEASACPLVVLSSEEFDRLDRAGICRLAEILKDYEIVPIIFLRNYADLIESMFRTHVLALGYPHPIVRFAAEEAPRLDCAELIREWSAIAHGGGAIVISYDDAAVRRDSISAFLAAMSVSAEIANVIERIHVHESAPAFVCEAVRYFRQEGVDENAVHGWLATVSRLKFDADTSRKYVSMPVKLREELNQCFSIEAAKIQSELGGSDRLRGIVPSSFEAFKGIVITNPLQALFAFARLFEIA